MNRRAVHIRVTAARGSERADAVIEQLNTQGDYDSGVAPAETKDVGFVGADRRGSRRRDCHRHGERWRRGQRAERHLEAGLCKRGSPVTGLLRIGALLFAVSGLSNAQFLLRLRSGNIDTYVAPGGAVTLNAKSRNTVVPFRISLANRGLLPVTCLQRSWPDLQISVLSNARRRELTLDAGQEFTASFQYKPTTDIRTQAQILFTVQDNPPDGTVGAKNVYILTVAANAADLTLLRVTEDDNVVGSRQISQFLFR